MKLSLETRQTQKQSQKLILTAQMKESLQILQMPLTELKEHIENEITENPVLEYDTVDYDNSYRKQLDIVKNFSNSNTETTKNGYSGEESDPFYAVSKKNNFYDFLQDQVTEAKIPPAISKICRYIIGNIDSRGYLTRSAEEIAEDLDVNILSVKKALTAVRKFDPAGVCAFDLSDCLKLQLKRLPVNDKHTFDIADNYLGLLSENKINIIAQRLGITAESAQYCCNIIKSLNPIPSSGYDTGKNDIFIIPEAEIFKDFDGKLSVKCNDNYVPQIYINSFYLRLAKNPTDKETEKYLKNKIKKASSLILEISNRKKTIIRILEKIVELQPLYFENGPGCLKPMAMNDIADKLNVNESTVCRAIQGKYILCANGIVSIRSLFTNGVGNIDFSSVSVKKKIIEIFKNENKLRPLSDQSVVSMLNEKENIKISRRTVAKYRQVLMIPPASKRKVYGEMGFPSKAVSK